MGRTNQTELPESEELRDIQDSTALKAALVERARKAGEPIALSTIEQSFQAIIRQRQVRRNLHDLSSHAASVEYVQVDVTDADTLANSVSAIYERYGRIDGVIHAAGIVEDRLLKDKTFESFMRVYRTKIVPMQVLTGSLRLDSLRFFVAISSMSARMGNRGQSDYAAANEALNKLAVQLARRSQCLVKALNYGPWSGPGMVSAQLEQQFRAFGISLISHAAGSRACVDEILFGDREHVEVLLSAQSAVPMTHSIGVGAARGLAAAPLTVHG